MKDDTQALEEVVVTALGMKREKKALGYAVTEMKGEDLNTNVVNPVSALQGKVAGVDISSGDGGLFGSSKILIRGASTLGNNNQPIYVVDGVILDNSVKVGDADWSTSDTDWGNELKNLNPDDFESVSVLKGAAATALYGSRGLNGAVVITTKSGKGKKGLGINFSQTFGIDHVYGGPSFQNVRGDGFMSGYSNYKSSGNMQDTNSFYLNADGKESVAWGGGYSWGPKFDGRPIEFYDYTTVPYSPYEDNFTDAFDNGFNTNTNVSIQGSNDTSSFYTSLSYKYADGNTPNNSFERFSFLAKASHKISKDVELEAGISFANSTPRQGGETNFGEKFIDGVFGRMYDTRYWRTRYKGSHGGLASNAYNDEYGNAPGKSVWWSVYENEYSQKETSVRPSLRLTADLNSWLKFTAEGNYNYYYKRYEAKELGDGYANEGGMYKLGQYTKEQTNLNANFSWNKTLNDFNISGFIRGEYYHNHQQEMEEKTNGGLIVPGQFFIGNSKNAVITTGKISGTKSILSVAGQFAVSWKDQVFLDVTGRNDWSSSLVYADQHGNYSYFYPSVSGSWLIHETFRGKMPEWISFAKLRASWAQVGNDTDAYTINTAYNLYGIDNTVGLQVPDTYYSANLKPERKNSWEVGVDLRFLKNRIGIDATYYKENTKNQIMKISVPSESGLSYQLINAGNIQNQGVEIALNTTPIETKDWTWDLNFTYTKNTSKIVELHPNVANYINLVGDAAYGNYRIASVAEVGGEYGLLKSDATPKYDEKTGLPILELASYNSRHSVYYSRSGEVKTVGSIQPDFLGSINTSLRYKNWTLRASMDMRFGGMVAIYGSHYGTAYGYLESSLNGTDAEHGGITYTSIWDGLTYDDGIIPNAIMPGGQTINVPKSVDPSGSYTIAKGGELYADLVNRGIVDPQHASSWNYWNNSWGRAAVWKNNDWFHELNYIALREVSLSYRMPNNIAKKIGASSINLTVAGRNLGYLLNSLPNNFNPESMRGTQAGQFMIRSVSPYTASYTFTINASF
ncbi:MAG: SusC/RagA family TonB-linked outer membrane protein, partial [Phocaeicola sp.]|nr:SusC/RagA family TonB-linked outer membrane protein [Phocaeicola sp.]